MTIEERVRKIVSEHLGVDLEKVVDEATLTEDLMADSIDLVELDMAVEEEFILQLEDLGHPRWNTVGDIVKEVKDLTNP